MDGRRDAGASPVSARILRFPVERVRPRLALTCARVWLNAEAPGASPVAQRAIARAEVADPRDVIHARWARAFLDATEATVAS